MNVSYDIVRICAAECELQQSGEMSVLMMVEAWSYALENAGALPTLDNIVNLGVLVDPASNSNGFRNTPVTFASGGVASHWRDVPDHMERLVSFIDVDVDATEVYRQFETIHPFADGNGRVGSILFNWLSGTLTEPQMPPKLFG